MFVKAIIVSTAFAAMSFGSTICQEYIYDKGKKVCLERILNAKMKSVNSISTVPDNMNKKYQFKGHEVEILNKVIVTFNENIDEESAGYIINSTSPVRYKKMFRNTYIVIYDSPKKAIEGANTLYEYGVAKTSQPDMKKKMIWR